MNIRDAMKGPQDPGKKGEGSGASLGRGIQEAFDTQAQFEKIYLEALDAVIANWSAAQKGKPISLKDLTSLVEKMANFLTDQKEGINLFKKVKQTPYYYLNVVDVGWTALVMGMDLAYPREKLIDLGVAALLHDIGMCRISHEILVKKEKLTFEEYELLRQHPDEGKKIVSAIPGVSQDVVLGVYQEHERENGSGYPEGKRGPQIHEFAKIIGLADLFDAMTHFRDYRTAVTPYDAIMEMVETKNRLFPDRLIKVFINQFTFYPVGSYVQMNTSEVGLVVKISRNFPTRPTVQILIDKEGGPVAKPYYLKLVGETLIYVKETLTEEKVQMMLEERKV